MPSYPGPGPGNYPRPRGGLICYTCGEPGHRTYECRATTILSREEQDKLRASRNRYPVYPYFQGGPPVSVPAPAPVAATTTGPMVPQLVAYVEVTDEELGLDQDTDPAGTMMMATQSVDLIEEGIQLKSEQMKSYISGLSDEERACLSLCLVAMAAKRTRNESEDELTEVAPQAQRQKVVQQTIPGTGSFQIQQPSVSTAASRNQPPVQSQQIPTHATAPRVTQAPRATTQQASHHEGIPFVLDPRFDDPTTWSNCVPSAAVPKTRGKRQQKKESKPKKHIKMMKGKTEWDPVEALRNTAVIGLDFGNLLDMSPSTRVLVGKALCKWGSGLLKSCLCFLTSKKHKQDCKQCGTTTWG